MSWELNPKKAECSFCGLEIKVNELIWAFRFQGFRCGKIEKIHAYHIKKPNCRNCSNKLKCITEGIEDNWNVCKNNVYVYNSCKENIKKIKKNKKGE